jgi:hypothetical protein
MFTPEEKRNLFAQSAALALGSSFILGVVAGASNGVASLLVWAIILPTFHKYIDR